MGSQPVPKVIMRIAAAVSIKFNIPMPWLLRGVAAFGLLVVIVGVWMLFFREKIPDTYGMYALNGGLFTELPASSGTSIDIEVDKESRFVLYDKKVAELAQTIKLNSFIFIRNTYVRRNSGLLGNQPGALGDPQLTSIWTRSNNSVAFQLEPSKRLDEMVYLVPRQPLVPGVYELRVAPSFSMIEGKNSTAFFVERPEVQGDKLYQGPHCYDRIKKMGMLNLSIAGEELVSCAEMDERAAKEAEEAARIAQGQYERAIGNKWVDIPAGNFFIGSCKSEYIPILT